jgi:hypothetical protein
MLLATNPMHRRLKGSGGVIKYESSTKCKLTVDTVDKSLKLGLCEELIVDVRNITAVWVQ